MHLSAIDADRLTILIPDLKLSCLRWVLQFIYTGEVYLQPHDVAPFIEACRFLQIRGVPYNEEQTVEIDFGTLISAMQEGTIVNNDGSEATAYLQEDVQQFSLAKTVEQSNALKAENETIKILCQEVSLSEPAIECNSSPDYPMEHEDSNAAIRDLLREGLEALPYQAENSTGCNPSMDEGKHQNSTNYASNDLLEAIAKSPSEEHLDPSCYDTRLSAAIDAIINRGISYRVASKQYNIAKTVLWRRTMKMPRLVRPTSPKLANHRSEAIDALKSGEKLVHVSQRFEIPLSTLHRDKIRLYKKGILPSKVTLKQRDKDEFFRQRLAEAVNECIAGRMSLSEAARVYNIPKTSIWRKVRSSKTRTSCTGGKEMARDQTKYDQDVRVLEHCVEMDKEDAEHTVGNLFHGSAYMSNRNADVSGTELTQDSIL
uniref:HTH psq-type domain-containing protein n=1 Tax=Anopheles minimus TaxID=112268 RepID=A0A182WPL9_9DIPT